MIKRLVNYIHMTGYSDSVAKNTCPPSRCNSKTKGPSLIISFMKWEPIRFCSKLMSLCRYCFPSPQFLSPSYFPTCASFTNLLTLPPKDKWDKSQGACRLVDSSHPDWHVMVPHCGFDLHFSDNEWCWASFHVFFSHLYLFLGEMSV